MPASPDKANVDREYGDLIEDAGNRSEAPVTNNHAAQLHPEGKSGVQPGQNVAQAKVFFNVNGGTSPKRQLILIGTCDFRAAGRVKHGAAPTDAASYSRIRCVSGLSFPSSV